MEFEAASTISLIEFGSGHPLDVNPYFKQACLPDAGAKIPGDAVVSG